MSDLFSGVFNTSNPATMARPVTLQDVNELPLGACRAIHVGVGGTITGRLVGDTADVQFLNVASGTQLSVRFQFIRAAGTTATNILALY